MKLVLFNEYRLGRLEGTTVVDVTDAVPGWDSLHPQASLVHIMQHFSSLGSALQRYEGRSFALEQLRLRPPVPNPSKIVAAPINYRKHMNEMHLDNSVAELGCFLKAPSSIIGPGDTIYLPFADRRTDHEAELAFVIGRTARNATASDALSYIFGYFCLMDISIRGHEDRSYRKSFDTFTPIGHCITTADEITDPNALEIKLSVNGETRQHSNTRYLLYNVQRLVEVYSHAMTLHPGDIISTGTPEGVGPLHPGDIVSMEIEHVGHLTVNVSARFSPHAQEVSHVNTHS